MTRPMAGGERQLLRVSVVVPTYRRLDILEKCLAGIEALEYPVERIVLVYRPKDDPETAHWLETNLPRHPTWVLAAIDQPGQVRALNFGIEHATGDIVAIFDDDAVPEPDWLTKIAAHFHQPDVAVAGGRDLINPNIEPVVNKDCPDAGRRSYWGSVVGKQHIVVGPPRDVDAAKGCNWAISLRALGSLRFDERLIGKGAQHGNDQWLCLNFRREGWRVVLDPTAIVSHYPASRLDGPRNQWSEAYCRSRSTNHVATETAYQTSGLKFRYLMFSLLVGSRYRPGLYFIAHSLLKRPGSLLGQVKGGWGGYLEGVRLRREFEKAPPGLPRPVGQVAAATELVGRPAL